MKKSVFKSEKLGNLGPIFSGIRTSYIKPDDDSGDIVVRIANWKNLKDIKNNTKFYPITEFKINSQKLFKREYGIIEKDTIIFFALPSLNEENIIYIDKDLEEYNLCGDNMYIFKNKSNIPTKYIFMVLNSGLYNDYLKYWKVNYNHKLGIQMLSEIEIPIIDNAEQLADEYFKIQQAKKELQNTEENLKKDVYEKVTNLMKL